MTSLKSGGSVVSEAMLLLRGNICISLIHKKKKNLLHEGVVVGCANGCVYIKDRVIGPGP